MRLKIRIIKKVSAAGAKRVRRTTKSAKLATAAKGEVAPKPPARKRFRFPAIPLPRFLPQAVRNIILATIWALFTLIMLWIPLSIVMDGPMFSTMKLLLYAAVLTLLCIGPRKTGQFLIKHQKYIHTLLIVAAFGGAVSCAIVLFGEYRAPAGDYGILFTRAVDMASSSELSEPQQQYLSIFPYTFNYTGFLALFMKVFGVAYRSVILLNIWLYFIGAFLIYFLMDRIYDKKTAQTASLLWLGNPVNIVWCAVCSPIMLVNTLVVGCLAATVFAFDYRNRLGKLLLFSTILGVTAGVSSGIRPVMVVFPIAVLVCAIVFICRQGANNTGKAIGTLLLGCLMMAGSFGAVAWLNIRVATEFAQRELAVSNPGWNLYLGANYSADGQWNLPDEDTLQEKIDSGMSATEVHNFFKDAALERYRQNSPTENLQLLLKKNLATSGNLAGYSYNASVAISRRTRPLLMAYLSAYWVFILSCGIICAFGLRKKRYNPSFALLPVLFTIGCYLSFQATEASPEYIMSLLTPLTIFAALGLSAIPGSRRIRHWV
ncbi:MAG: glycosyltransferase family 39 protein [Acidobacteriota bacterium]|nr:glycosyltransferase family 39 protein [Acidobacteriota bacterium]